MMPKTSDGKIALLALIAMAAWLLIALPIIYAPSAFDLRKWLTHDAAGFFTSLLVIVGALQLALFIWQLRLIRASLDGAQIASDAAAVAAKAASRQAHIAEETLAKIERPYLFVFNVSSVKVETWEDIEGDGSRLAVTYSVANYGKLPAIIQWLQVSSAYSQSLSIPRMLISITRSWCHQYWHRERRGRRFTKGLSGPTLGMMNSITSFLTSGKATICFSG
jgi:hypothetical protein